MTDERRGPGAGGLLAELERAVLQGDAPAAARLANEAVAGGLEPLAAIDQGLVPDIRRAGELWEEGEYFLPELVTSAEAMKAAMAVLVGGVPVTRAWAQEIGAAGYAGYAVAAFEVARALVRHARS